jgi:hypothetical protein
MRTARSLFVLIVMLLAFPASASADTATHIFVRLIDENRGTTPVAGVEGTFFFSPRDASNAFDPGFTGPVHFSSSDPQAVLPADTTLDHLHAIGGGYLLVATFKTAGPQTATVTQVGVADPITGTSAPTPVAAAAATHLTIGVPAQAKPGIPLTFTVTARDQFGNRAPTYDGTVHFTSSDPSATLPADAQLTQGTAAFKATLEASGSQTIAATDTVAGAPFAAMGGTAVAGPVTQFQVIGPVSSVAGFPALVGVRALDAAGALMDFFQGSVHFTSSDARAKLPADAELVDGEALVFTTFATPGLQTISVADAANGEVAGTSEPVVVGVLPPPPPPDGGAQPPPPPPPAIGGLAVKPLCVRKARLLSTLKSGRGALALSFSLNAGARVSIALERLVHAAPPAHCPRRPGSTQGAVKRVRTFDGSASSGRYSLAIAARAARRTIQLAGTAAAAKALAPGAYLVRVRATDASGRRSALATAKFFVLR